MHVVRLAKPKWRNNKPANLPMKAEKGQLNRVLWHTFSEQSLKSLMNKNNAVRPVFTQARTAF
jgi:hypothetical protein